MQYDMEADSEHIVNLEAILTSGIIDDATADEIVRCAQVVAALRAAARRTGPLTWRSSSVRAEHGRRCTRPAVR